MLEADGGTRTASITGAFVALALAVNNADQERRLQTHVLRDSVAATSVGCMKDHSLALDLCYVEDSTAEVDLNVVATGGGGIVEIQGTAEGEPVPRKTIDAMVDLALAGVASLGKVQRAALTAASVDLDSLLAR